MLARYTVLFALSLSMLTIASSDTKTNADTQNISDPFFSKWWKAPYPDTFNNNALSNKLPAISVHKNTFIDTSGNTVIFRGVNSADPDKLKREGKWDPSYFEEVKRWGANIVRLPVHPSAWRSRGEPAYLELLDQAVLWANAQELYLIIDWHSIGNLKAGVFQHPMYETSMPETLRFWQSIAHRYKGVTTVAFYELFNEPTQGGGRFSSFTWNEWKVINENMIDLIQSHDKNVVSLVGGFNWAYDLSPAKGNLIDRKNVAYVSHPYPQKEKKEPMEKGWENKFGFITKHAPLIATEIGWMHDDEYGAHIPVINNNDNYGPRITNYLDNIGASWVAWVFDPDWTPNMISDWQYTPTTQGQYFKEVMVKYNNQTK